MKRASMKRTKSESGMAQEVAPPSDPDIRDPWGLRITLEDQELKKLNHSGDFKVGDKVGLSAVARVKAVRSSEVDGNANSSRTVELQIEELGLDENAQLETEFAEKDDDEKAPSGDED